LSGLMTMGQAQTPNVTVLSCSIPVLDGGETFSLQVDWDKKQVLMAFDPGKSLDPVAADITANHIAWNVPILHGGSKQYDFNRHTDWIAESIILVKGGSVLRHGTCRPMPGGSRAILTGSDAAYPLLLVVTKTNVTHRESKKPGWADAGEYIDGTGEGDITFSDGNKEHVDFSYQHCGGVVQTWQEVPSLEAKWSAGFNEPLMVRVVETGYFPLAPGHYTFADCAVTVSIDGL